MPLVLMNRDPEVIDDETARKLAQELPAIVADALDISEYDKDGALTAKDVEVYVQDSTKLDVNTKPLEITIWAGYYPARQKDLDRRRAKIAEAVRAIKPPDIKGFVWVLLQPGSFEEL
jgi:hypothetical protein